MNATIAYLTDMGAALRVDLYVGSANLTDQLAFARMSFVKDLSPLRGRSVAVGMRHRF